jgi:hypothetical protein
MESAGSQEHDWGCFEGLGIGVINSELNNYTNIF